MNIIHYFGCEYGVYPFFWLQIMNIIHFYIF